MVNEIKAGDLVYVAKALPCCGAKHWLGEVFTASSVITTGADCRACGSYLGTCTVAMCKGREGAYDLRCLRRIPPLWELDDIKNKEEIPA